MARLSDRLGRLKAAPRAAAAALSGPHALFWWSCAAIFVAGAVLRTFRLDMPPFDFPADRQRTNVNLIRDLMDGGSLFAPRGNWLELPILPWLTARTHWIASLFGIELWTLARVYAALLGMATVALAPLAGYFAAAAPAVPEPRRRRLALLFMAAVAFNPYLINLSRLIMTEPVTLFFQMAAVAWFFIAWRRSTGPPETRRPATTALALAVGFFCLACWAKIPALIWAPAFALCLVGGRMLRRRSLAIVLGLALAGAAVFFSIYRINPFAIERSFAERFPFYAAQSRQWSGSALWMKTYFTRLVLMLTLPGLVLAGIGLLRAPWLFRIAFLVFCLIFERLVMLNYYNFCHVIIPGMALAAWGADWLIEGAAGDLPAPQESAARPPGARKIPWADVRRLAGAALLAAAMGLTYPLGANDSHDPLPRAEVTQAVNVIHGLTSPGTVVMNNDVEGSLTHMLRQEFDTASSKFDLHTGYFYSIDRLSTDSTVREAAGAWVRWASLPGEPGGILFTREARTQLPLALTMQYASLQLAPPSGASGLQATRIDVPRQAFDRQHGALRVATGTTLTLGVQWRNPDHAALAGIRWVSAEWKTAMAIPLSQGGFAYPSTPVALPQGGYALYNAGVACLPPGEPSSACYDFAIPPGMPSGTYGIDYYPLPDGAWRPPDRATAPTRLPFVIVVVDGASFHLPATRPFIQLYPMDYMTIPTVYEPAWTYGGLRLTGYRLVDAERFLFSCPAGKPGIYGMTIRGEAVPVTSADSPDGLWPSVDLYLPATSAPLKVGSIALRSTASGEFSCEFRAPTSFDSVMLQVHLPPRGAVEPRWLLYFNPASYGRPSITLRSARLESVPGS